MLIKSSILVLSSSILRWYLIVISIITLLVVLLGSGVNNHGNKYAIGFENCKIEIFNKNLENSNFCCEKHLHHHDWICIAASDGIVKVLTSSYAFILPLVPWTLTVLFDVIGRLFIKNYHYLPAFNHLRRLIIYICIILCRTVSV